MCDEIDVVMLTKNSNRPHFRRSLSAIKRNIPVHHFIVVDSHSTDRTLEVVREFFNDRLVIIETEASLGLARYIGMRLVDTEWFAFIDSDVEILDGWYENAMPFMKLDKVYGIQGTWASHDVDESTTNITVLRHINTIPRNYIVRDGFYRFAGADSGHVLLRREVVRLLDPKVISILGSGEDFYIAQKINEAGYYYVRTNNLKAIHHGVKLDLKKLIKRSFNIHGLALYMDAPTFFQYSLVRSFANLMRRNSSQFLNHILYLIGFIRVKTLLREAGYRYSKRC